LPRPAPSKAQLIGIALHEKAEKYIGTGELDYSGDADAARLLPAILPYLPRGASTEKKVSVTLDGILFAGRYDWLIPEGPELGDLKTTSSLRWVKTVEELSVHPQPVIYAAATSREASCRWLYVQTRGAAHVREVRFKPDFGALDSIIADGKAITKAWTDRGDPNSYEPTLSACDQYGGCPFRMQCKVDSGQRLATLLGIKPAPVAPKEEEPPIMSTFEELMKNLAVNPPPVAEAVTRTEELPPVLTIAQEVPAKRKRRTKAEMAADEAGAVAVEAALTAPDTDRPAADKPIGTLYVSCFPVGENAEIADYIFKAANAKVSEQQGVEDYRMVQFNAARGHFVATVEAMIRELRPEVLVVDNRGAEATDCIVTLVAMSQRVVRAL
jgi:hypothetical protein